ncbi:MAG TPA: pitrilysin family protein [Myxococcales bacterium]|nr:pitrilysin family protein [Myxococcales bacterium]
MLRRIAIAVLVLGAVQARAADPEVKFEKYRLKNGLTVILSEDHRLPQVSVNVWYHVGAANQTAGHSGFAHLFEHMMFSGSKHAKDPDTILEQIGASNRNGSTNFDRTNYYETVPTNELPTALWLESDRMGFLLPTLDEQKLKIQRDVVSNEYRQRIENVPYGPSQQRLCDLLYPLPHPYYECVIGVVGEIQAASLQDVREFFQHFYGPNNASLVLVGDFDPTVAKRLIDKYFSAIPRGPEVKRPEGEVKPIAATVKETIEDKLAQLPQVELVWNGVKPFSDDEPAGDVLTEVLAGGKTSRLYQRLVLDKQVASNVDAANPSLGLGGWIQVGATAAPGHGPDELRAHIQHVLDDVKQNGVTKEEVDRAKFKIVAGDLRSLERGSARADILNQYEMWLGDPGFLPRDLARYRAVTPAAVQAFARKYLPDDRRLELTTVPAAKRTASAPGGQP